MSEQNLLGGRAIYCPGDAVAFHCCYPRGGESLEHTYRFGTVADDSGGAKVGVAYLELNEKQEPVRRYRRFFRGELVPAFADGYFIEESKA